MTNQQLSEKQEESGSKAEKTFLQLVLTFPFIGEYLTTAIAIIPAILIFWLKLFRENERWELISVTSLTFLWIIFLERKGKVKICTPHLPIPIKWLLVPIAIIMLFYY